ncbi:hypothetical protein HMPREF3038_02799 [Akkermansia sp. KLE1797]|nr:hypothetical protein HMPREF3038_02799 [Akkermansia sp. KLE1797]
MESVLPSSVFNPAAILEPFTEKPHLPPVPETTTNPSSSRSQ